MSVGSVIEVVTTFPDEASARDCAERIVRGGLAACVQVEGPVHSVYVWQGRLESGAEWRCTCKTSPGGRAACVTAILEGHPYGMPQIVWRECGATSDYAAWVARP